MILYFAGSEPKINSDILLQCGVKSFLHSAYTLKYTKTPEIEKYDNYLLDSGGFSARKNGVKIKVEDYANFINKLGVKIAFNLDTNDIPETLRNQEYLEKNTKAYILPIYHYSDFITLEYKGLLDEYIGKYPYIAVGGVAKMGIPKINNDIFFRYVFNKTKDNIKVHGLGMTALGFNYIYPFYSTDSTSWQQAMRYGRNPFEDKKMSILKNKYQHYLKRSEPLIKEFLKQEKNITNLWSKRGIIWK